MSKIALIKSYDAAHQVVPFDAPVTSEAVAPPAVTDEPSPIERELTETKAALERARAELHEVEQSWQKRFDAALATAAEEVEAQFRADDEARIAVLAECAEVAITTFRAEIVEPAERMGVALAHCALNRFGAERAADADFLAAVVRTEVSRVTESVLLCIQVSPVDASEKVLRERLQSTLPATCRIDIDAAIPTGTVRLRLRLGHVDVNVAEGLAQLSAMLLAGASDL